MIIVFTLDMIFRLVYYWFFFVFFYGNYIDYIMKGYINNTFFIFNISDFIERSRENLDFDFGDYIICR